MPTQGSFPLLARVLAEPTSSRDHAQTTLGRAARGRQGPHELSSWSQQGGTPPPPPNLGDWSTLSCSPGKRTDRMEALEAAGKWDTVTATRTDTVRAFHKEMQQLRSGLYALTPPSNSRPVRPAWASWAGQGARNSKTLDSQ